MLSGRQLLAVVGLVLAIAACERTIAGPTVYVDRPPRADTVIVIRPETTFVQQPGRVDTVVTWDTLRLITHDTVVVHDTVRHTDTLIVHDTAWRDRAPAWVCLSLLRHDTLFALNPSNGPYCDAAHLAAHFPTATVGVDVDTLHMTLPAPASPNRIPRSTRILPSWWSTHP